MHLQIIQKKLCDFSDSDWYFDKVFIWRLLTIYDLKKSLKFSIRNSYLTFALAWSGPKRALTRLCIELKMEFDDIEKNIIGIIYRLFVY